MTVEERLAALEARLQAAEDELAIMRLLASYGPLVDSGQSEAAAAMWIAGGTYDYSGGAVAHAPDGLIAACAHSGGAGGGSTPVPSSVRTSSR